jgi:hypothetical protein
MNVDVEVCEDVCDQVDGSSNSQQPHYVYACLVIKHNNSCQVWNLTMPSALILGTTKTRKNPFLVLVGSWYWSWAWFLVLGLWSWAWFLVLVLLLVLVLVLGSWSWFFPDEWLHNQGYPFTRVPASITQG